MSVVQVMGRSGGSGLGQRNPFWGFNVPEEVKQMVRCLKKADQGSFRAVLKSESRAGTAPKAPAPPRFEAPRLKILSLLY